MEAMEVSKLPEDILFDRSLRCVERRAQKKWTPVVGRRRWRRELVYQVISTSESSGSCNPRCVHPSDLVFQTVENETSPGV